MKYSNGYDIDRVMPVLQARIGWKQPTASQSPVIDTDNKNSESGRYFNHGFHSLVTIDNIKATMPEANADDTTLNSHLKEIEDAAIYRCLSTVFIPDSGSDKYLQQVLIFDRHGQNDTIVENTNKFVGFEINLAPKVDLAHFIDAAILYFNQDVTFKLYLFKDGKKAPVEEVEVSAVAYEPTYIALSDFVLKYINAALAGGRYFFGYFQSDLGNAKAIREQACRQNQTTCLSVQSVYMQQIANQVDFNRDERSYLTTPYGLNLLIGSFQDFTDLIIRKASLFDEAIGLCAAYNVLENIIYATRSNATERIIKDEVDKVGMSLDLNGAAPISDSPRIKGLSQRIDKELNRIRQTFYPRVKPTTVNFASC